MTLLAALFSVLLAQVTPAPAPQDQRASDPSIGRNTDRTALPAPGIIEGTGNGLAGGRTDKGPDGRTGIGERVSNQAHKQAKKDVSVRGRNAPGSFDRPAETAADMETNPHPKAMGSGADTGGFPEGGENYGVRGAAHGQAGGIASGSGSPGGAAPNGPAGKSDQPEDHSSSTPETPKGPNH